MASITFTDSKGTARTVEGEEGATVMETAIRNGGPGDRRRMRRRLRLRHLPCLYRRAVRRQGRQAVRDGGGHARLRLRGAAPARASPARSRSRRRSTGSPSPRPPGKAESRDARDAGTPRIRRSRPTSSSSARARSASSPSSSSGLLDIRCHLIDINAEGGGPVRRALSREADLRHPWLPEHHGAGDRRSPDGADRAVQADLPPRRNWSRRSTPWGPPRRRPSAYAPISARRSPARRSWSRPAAARSSRKSRRSPGSRPMRARPCTTPCGAWKRFAARRSSSSAAAIRRSTGP